MWIKKLTRRQLLALGGMTLAGKFLEGVSAQAPTGEPIRIGAVLPMKSGETPMERTAPYDRIGEAARMGATMAGDELSYEAEFLGVDLQLLLGSAPSADAAVRAAHRLVSIEGVCALIGGLGQGQAIALSQVAEGRQIPFFNIGAPSDALRGGACNRYTFHVEASAGMYLDALVEWFIRSHARRWFLVYADSSDGEALYNRTLKSLQARQVGVHEVGHAVVIPEQPAYFRELDAIREANPDVVLLLLDAVDQATFLAQYDSLGLEFQVTGFPDPVTQTREYFSVLQRLAPRVGVGQRVALWETTLNVNGARELNDRFISRWGQPMDPSAWAAYQSVKILSETILVTGTCEASKLIEYLESPQAVFDGHKGIDVSFRPWDHQLRQPLYLVEISPEAGLDLTLTRKLARASLVGEMPTNQAPDADAVELLDQLGDGPHESRCHF